MAGVRRRAGAAHLAGRARPGLADQAGAARGAVRLVGGLHANGRARRADDRCPRGRVCPSCRRPSPSTQPSQRRCCTPCPCRSRCRWPAGRSAPCTTWRRPRGRRTFPCDTRSPARTPHRQHRWARRRRRRPRSSSTRRSRQCCRPRPSCRCCRRRRPCRRSPSCPRCRPAPRRRPLSAAAATRRTPPPAPSSRPRRASPAGTVQAASDLPRTATDMKDHATEIGRARESRAGPGLFPAWRRRDDPQRRRAAREHAARDEPDDSTASARATTSPGLTCTRRSARSCCSR